jgi:uncharacterized protein
MTKFKLFIFVIFLFVFVLLVIGVEKYKNNPPKIQVVPQLTPKIVNANPLSIYSMKNAQYPGSNIKIEQQLSPTANYEQYITSYLSEGLKIYALLTVPQGKPPDGGWPVILFNHGYIPPDIYRTTERYIAYVDSFARNGYIVFKPDYRGNGNSEGKPEGAYYSPAYTIDDLNALTSIKKYPGVNPTKIGVWGHSMGGNITLRDLIISKDIKAAVIWGGVVGSYNDLMNNWQRQVTYNPPPRELSQRNQYRQNLVTKYGTPSANPTFWDSIDPTHYVSDITVPIQLDVGGADEEVPVAFSESLRDKLTAAGKYVEFYNYPGADHNISQSFNEAMKNSLDFFNRYLK